MKYMNELWYTPKLKHRVFIYISFQTKRIPFRTFRKGFYFWLDFIRYSIVFNPAKMNDTISPVWNDLSVISHKDIIHIINNARKLIKYMPAIFVSFFIIKLLPLYLSRRSTPLYDEIWLSDYFYIYICICQQYLYLYINIEFHIEKKRSIYIV